MKITLKQTTERQVEIPVPSFWKKVTGTIKEYVALPEEETVIKFFVSDDFTNIVNGASDTNQDILLKAYSTFDLCSEEEFFAEFEKAYKSLSLSPTSFLKIDMGPWNEHLKEV